MSRKLNGSREIPGLHDRIEGLEWLDKIVDIDQSPIGRTPRSNPATYTGAFGPIRDWFAGLPEAKTRGYARSEEHTSELQSLMRNTYAALCLTKNTDK